MIRPRSNSFFTALLCISTLVAFAANSILCRLALMSGSIGPIEFTSIRLASGIVALLPVLALSSRFRPRLQPTRDESKSDAGKRSAVWPAITLFCYALFFSLAYTKLQASTGALILFAAVQITMMTVSIARGNRVTPVEWAGLGISSAGLVYLLSPGLAAPPITGTILMAVSGISWGVYSLLGQHQRQPIVSTARNFLYCAPGVAAIVGWTFLQSDQIQLTSRGLVLALASGALASGMGYVLWYVTLRRITTTVASVSQLAVPVLAAIGGVVFLQESVSIRLVAASILVVGGIVMTIVGRSRRQVMVVAPQPAQFESTS